MSVILNFFLLPKIISGCQAKRNKKPTIKKTLMLLILTGIAVMNHAQEVIPLKFEKNQGITYENAERKYYSEVWQTTVVTNVSEPSLSVFQPSEDKKNGTAVIIAPGGGLFGLSINSEGIDVPQWLVARGVTAFVLKYRLVPTGLDGTTEISEQWEQDLEAMMEKVGEVLPFSVQDGLNAVAYVRENAEKYGVEEDKIGFIGFSGPGLSKDNGYARTDTRGECPSCIHCLCFQ
jgi:hypothetical protein